MPPTHERPNLEWRIKALERRMATQEERFREFVNARRQDEEQDSSADLSVHPGRLRLSLRNLPSWVYLAIFVVVAIALVTLVGGSIQRHHAPLPEAASGLIPAPEFPSR